MIELEPFKQVNLHEVLTPDKSAIEDVEDFDSAIAENVANSSFDAKLGALRAKNPFLPIETFGQSGVLLNLSSDVPQIVDIPAGAKYAKMVSQGVVIVSRNGAPIIPPANGSNQYGQFLLKNEALIYVREAGSFSVLCLDSKSLFSVSFFF